MASLALTQKKGLPAVLPLAVVVGYLLLVSLPTTSTSSLYQPSDPIVQLTTSNFYETIRNTPNAWFIEFYAHWCGHCKRLANTYKKLAHNVKDWGHVIKLGAIACSQPRNVPICRKMQVHGYPTLRFFPPYLKNKNYVGVEYVGAGTLEGLLAGMVDYVSSVRGKPRAWPIMDPVSSTQDILQRIPLDVTTVLAIVENPADSVNDNIAKQLLFDLSGIPGVHVMRLRKTDTASGLYELYQDRTLVVIATGTNRDHLLESALKVVRRPDGVPAADATSPPTPPIMSRTSTSGLHMQDLEAGLYHSLWLEVGANFNISGAAFEALTNHVRTTARYFPGNHYIMGFLHNVDHWLHTLPGWVSGSDWIEGLDKLKSSDAYVPDRLRWTGCAGSQPGFRGYPCSLWQIFHALTVNGLETNIRNPQYDSRIVLLHIREYVRHFLGCRECARHFLAMASDIENKVKRPRDGVLWLWQAHNRVNRRLAGDETEDPRHPKKEFPTVAQCPTCRITRAGRNRGRHKKNNATMWNEEEVMIFLRRFYGKDFVIPDNVHYSYTAHTNPPPVYIPPESEVWENAELTGNDFKIQTITTTSPTTTTTSTTMTTPTTTTTTPTPTTRPTTPTTTTTTQMPWTPGRSWTQRPRGHKSRGRDRSRDHNRSREHGRPRDQNRSRDHRGPHTDRPWTPRPWTPNPWTPAPMPHQPDLPYDSNPAYNNQNQPYDQFQPYTPNPPFNNPNPPNTQNPPFDNQNPPYTLSPPYRYPNQPFTPVPPNQPIPAGTPQPYTPRPHRQVPTRRPTFRPTPEPLPFTLRTSPMKECHVVTTEWSPCSATCGSGLSTRLTTKKPSCKMELESRICHIRPCNYRFVRNQWSACGSTYRSANYLPLTFGDCRSLNYVQWRYCGECVGKCCHPTLSYTEEMAFMCGSKSEEKVTAYANVELIKLCECNDQCP